MKTRWVVAGVVAVAGFALTWPMTTIALETLGTEFVGFGRSVVAGILAAVFIPILRLRFPGWRAMARITVVALLVVVSFPFFSSLALQTIPSAQGVVLAGLIPPVTAATAVLLGEARRPPRFWAFSTLGALLGGVYIVVSGGGAPGPAELWAVIAVVSAGVGFALGAEVTRRLGAPTLICWGLIGVAPLTVPLTLASLPEQAAGGSSPSWLAFLYMGAVSVFGAFFLWYAALARGGSARIAQLQLLQPLFAVAAAGAVLGERLGVLVLALAAAMLLCGALALLTTRAEPA